MEDLLDNPIWYALNTGNKDLSNGNTTGKFFHPDVAPFVGLEFHNTEHFKAFENEIQPERIVTFITADDIFIPTNWNTIRKMNLLQMVCSKPNFNAVQSSNIIALDDKNIEAMLALTKLTQPGPFYNRTILFGNYAGIFNDGSLIAMAGQRFFATPFREISAVCTHPNFTGKGYAAELISFVGNAILQRNEIPFLHVREDNTGAIKLYEKLGFVIRKKMFLNIIQKKSSFTE